MNFKDWLETHVPESVFVLITTIVGWLAQRAIHKVDRQEARIAALERDRVTRDDFAQLQDRFDAGIEKIQQRTDQILFHMAKDD